MFKNTIQMPTKSISNLSEQDVKKVESVIQDQETLDQMRKFAIVMTLHHKKTL